MDDVRSCRPRRASIRQVHRGGEGGTGTGQDQFDVHARPRLEIRDDSDGVKRPLLGHHPADQGQSPFLVTQRLAARRSSATRRSRAVRARYPSITLAAQYPQPPAASMVETLHPGERSSFVTSVRRRPTLVKVLCGIHDYRKFRRQPGQELADSPTEGLFKEVHHVRLEIQPT